MTVRRIGFAVPFLVFLAGCPATPKSPTKPGDVPRAEGQVVGLPAKAESRAGLPTQPVEGWELLRDDRTLRVSYLGGREPCGMLDHVEVDFSDKVIELVAWLGLEKQEAARQEAETKRTGAFFACELIGIPHVATVVLTEPAMGRRIVDRSVSPAPADRARQLATFKVAEVTARSLETYRALRARFGNQAPPTIQARDDRSAWFVVVVGEIDRTNTRPKNWFLLDPSTLAVIARGDEPPA